ncbi:MAG: phosphate acyltransferase PlsX [Elusimicrobiota bacterium]|jgi:glycerol-3-phosphate acyltransferase PlsX|nr:phosphate acyltransferase PlsX [Elusimicrobiota bacterium]
MKIALDALGGDFGAKPNVLGAVKAAREFGCEVILVGDAAVIKEELASAGGYDEGKISIIHAPDVIDMEASPVREVKNKKNASVVVCAQLVKDGKADAMISAGNSGATMVAGYFVLKRIKGVDRPAIASPMPTQRGVALVLDAGANADCKALNLLQFAVMGSIYSRAAYGVASPLVGLMSIGEEEGKGNLLVKETAKYIKNLGVNYYGNIEGRDVHTGMIDVVVCDGFVGNIILKLSEGLAKSLFKMIKEGVKKNPFALLGLLMAKGALMKVKESTDPDSYGGAPLLGVDGPVIICHGKSSERAIFNAIRVAGKVAQSKATTLIKEQMAVLKPVFDKLGGESEGDVQE